MSEWSCPFDACNVVFPAKTALDAHIQHTHISVEPPLSSSSQPPKSTISVIITSGSPAASSHSSDDDSSSSDSAQRVPSRDLPDVSTILDRLEMPEDPLSTVGQVNDKLLLKLSAQTRLSEIKSINLRDVCISQFRPSENLHLAALSHLEFLDLSKNFISNLSGVAILTHLRVLKLDSNQLHAINELFELKRLKVLTVEKNFLKSIRGFPVFESLKELSLAHNRLISEEELLESLLPQPKLRVLRIEGNPLMRRTRHMRYRLLKKLHLSSLDNEEITMLDYDIATSLEAHPRDMAFRRRRNSAVEEITGEKTEEMKTKLKDEIGYDFNFRRVLASLKRKLGPEYEATLDGLITKVLARSFRDKLSIP